MKKKLILLVVVLVAAVIIVSGCSEDALKDRVPGVKANVSMLLADNDEGDLEYEVGEVKTEEDFESSSSAFGTFGSDLIVEIEEEISGLNTTTTGISTGLNVETNDTGETMTKTFESENIEIDFNDKLTANDDLSSMLENIVFDDDSENAGAELEITVSDSKINITSFEVNIGKKIYTSSNGTINLSNEVLDFSKNTTVTIKAEVTVEDGETVPTELDLTAGIKEVNNNNNGNVSIASLDVEITEVFFNDLVADGDYKPSIDEALIEGYEKEDFIDVLTVSDSEMYVNFDIAEGINLDLSGVVVKSDPEIAEYTFPLAKEDLTSENSRAVLDLNKIVSMLQNDNTKDVNIAGDIALSSDGIITITKESELGVKNAVLESAEFKIDNYQMEPEAAEEGLTSKEVEDIKKGLDNVEVTVEGINNPLPAAVDLKFYVKDGASTKDELFKAENKVTTFNLKANTVNGEEIIVIDKDQFDKFIGNDLYVGLELYSDVTFTKEEYNEKKVTIEKVKTKFNVDLKVDDLDE